MVLFQFNCYKKLEQATKSKALCVRVSINFPIKKKKLNKLAILFQEANSLCVRVSINFPIKKKKKKKLNKLAIIFKEAN